MFDYFQENSLKEWSYKSAITLETYDGYDPIPVPSNIIYSVAKLLKLVKKKEKTKVLLNIYRNGGSPWVKITNLVDSFLEMEKKHTMFSVSNLLVGKICFPKLYNAAHALFHVSTPGTVNTPYTGVLHKPLDSLLRLPVSLINLLPDLIDLIDNVIIIKYYQFSTQHSPHMTR